MNECHIAMPRKVTTEPVKRLMVELPESEYQALDEYCLDVQQTKRQVVRDLLRGLRLKHGKGK
jgi:hypothetical protein